MWGHLPARILAQSRRLLLPGPQHAITLFKFPFWSRMFLARTSVAPPDTFYLFPRSILLLRSLGYGLYHAYCSTSVTGHAIRHSVTHVPCRATGVPEVAFVVFPRTSRAVSTTCFPLDYSCLSLCISYMAGSKWAVLYKMAFSDPAGFRWRRSPGNRNRHYVITLLSL